MKINIENSLKYYNIDTFWQTCVNTCIFSLDIFDNFDLLSQSISTKDGNRKIDEQQEKTSEYSGKLQTRKYLNIIIFSSRFSVSYECASFSCNHFLSVCLWTYLYHENWMRLVHGVCIGGCWEFDSCHSHTVLHT